MLSSFDGDASRLTRKTKPICLSQLRHASCAIFLTGILGVLLVSLLSQAQSETGELTNIRGIDDVTKGQIDSGEWSKEAIVIDQEKGLLPPDPLDGGLGSADLAASSLDDAKKKKRSSSQSGDEEGQDSGNQGSQGSTNDDDDSEDDSINGHCKQDVHIKCTSHAECGPLGGCVQWHCSNYTNIKCVTSDDCNSSAGICTGAGYCRSNPETACSKTEDCQIYEDSQCLYGGTCQQNSQVACIQDSDCSAGDTCSFHIKEWWEAGTDFPVDDDAEDGFYANWTEFQLRKKVLVALKKILYLQKDMVSQVPINRMLNQSMAELARRKGEILRVNVPQVRQAQKIMQQTIVNATLDLEKHSATAIVLVRDRAKRFNESIIAKNTAHDNRVLQIEKDFDLINETVNSSYYILLSRMDDLWNELNDTIVVLNNTQHQTNAMLLERFKSTFDAAKTRLWQSLKEIEDMPSIDYYKGLKDVETMFRNFRQDNRRYFAQIKRAVKENTGGFSASKAGLRDMNASYFNSTLRAALKAEISNFTALSPNVTLLEQNLTALEKALKTFEHDYPLPSS